MKMRVMVMMMMLLIDQDGLKGLQEAPMLDGIDHSSVVIRNQDSSPNHPTLFELGSLVNGWRCRSRILFYIHPPRWHAPVNLSKKSVE
jgi:hypothetical protein